MSLRRSHALAWLTAALVAPTLPARSAAAAKGDGAYAEEERPAEGVEAIRVDAPIRVIVSQGGASRATLSGDRNLLPIVVTRVEERTLVVVARESFDPLYPLTLSVSVPRLSAVSIGGAAAVSLGAFRGGELRLEVSGAADVRAGELQFSTISADVSGASHLTLSGHAERARLSVGGAANLDGGALTAGTASVQVSGPSSLTLGASGALTGAIAGGGFARYYGSRESAAGLSVSESSTIQFL